jgi:hypothetical protein
MKLTKDEVKMLRKFGARVTPYIAWDKKLQTNVRVPDTYDVFIEDGSYGCCIDKFTDCFKHVYNSGKEVGSGIQILKFKELFNIK